MKQTRSWLIVIIVLLCNITVNAYDFRANGISYEIISDSTVCVTYYDKYTSSGGTEFNSVKYVHAKASNPLMNFNPTTAIIKTNHQSASRIPALANDIMLPIIALANKAIKAELINLTILFLLDPLLKVNAAQTTQTAYAIHFYYAFFFFNFSHTTQLARTYIARSAIY